MLMWLRDLTCLPCCVRASTHVPSRAETGVGIAQFILEKRVQERKTENDAQNVLKQLLREEEQLNRNRD